MFARWSEPDLIKMHAHLLRLFDNIHAGRIDISGFGLEMVERLLVNILEENERRGI